MKFGEETREGEGSAALTGEEIILLCYKAENISCASFHFSLSSFTILVVNLDHSSCLFLSLFFIAANSSFDAM